MSSDPTGLEIFSTMPFPTIGDTSWQREAVNTALDMFAGARSLHERAAMFVRTHPRAIQYLEAMPALIHALPATPDKALAEMRKWREGFERGDRLRDFAGRAKLALPLRRLSARGLPRCDATLLRRLSALPASTLAQAIPDDQRHQAAWLEACMGWRNRMRACDLSPDFAFDWAIIAMSRAQAWHQWREIADLFVARRAEPHARLTWQRAYAEAEAWHRELNAKRDNAAFFHQHGRQIDEVIDYAPLPAAHHIGEVSIAAVQTGEALHAEGRAMRHCVASYAGDVIRGKCRIYTIREGERRLATMEIVGKPGHWRIAQIKGPCNAAPKLVAEHAARMFLAEINKQSEAAQAQAEATETMFQAAAPEGEAAMDDDTLIAAYQAHKAAALAEGNNMLTRRMVIILADMADMPPVSLVWRLEKLGCIKQGSLAWFRANGGITRAHVDTVRAERAARCQL